MCLDRPHTAAAACSTALVKPLPASRQHRGQLAAQVLVTLALLVEKARAIRRRQFGRRRRTAPPGAASVSVSPGLAAERGAEPGARQADVLLHGLDAQVENGGNFGHFQTRRRTSIPWRGPCGDRPRPVFPGLRPEPGGPSDGGLVDAGASSSEIRVAPAPRFPARCRRAWSTRIWRMWRAAMAMKWDRLSQSTRSAWPISRRNASFTRAVGCSV